MLCSALRIDLNSGPKVASTITIAKNTANDSVYDRIEAVYLVPV